MQWKISKYKKQTNQLKPVAESVVRTQLLSRVLKKCILYHLKITYQWSEFWVNAVRETKCIYGTLYFNQVFNLDD